MSRFRVTMTPGVIRKPDDELLIRFRGPRSARKVKITLVEMDTWEWKGTRRKTFTMVETPDSVSNPIITFEGALSRRAFTASPAPKIAPNKKLPVLKVRFNNKSGPLYQVPIPDSSFTKEGGSLEIGIRVEGMVAPRRGGGAVQRRYRSTMPVFVRHYAKKATARRPVITFLTVSSGTFYKDAKSYWGRRADVLVTGCRSFESILKYLKSSRTQAALRKHKVTSWAEINIVTHASVNAINLPLFSKQRNPSQTDSDQLTRYAADKRLSPVKANVDKETRVVIRGCGLGKSMMLLDNIRQFFPSKPYVYGPRYKQLYQSSRVKGVPPREYFEEFFYFYVPGTKSPSSADCLKALKGKYSSASLSEDEWKRLIRGAGNRTRKDRTVRYTHGILSKQRPPKDRDLLKNRLVTDWPNLDSTYNTNVNDWKWTIRRQKFYKKNVGVMYRVKYEGRRRLIEVMRPLVDKNGNDIVPNLEDANHYDCSCAP